MKTQGEDALTAYKQGEKLGTNLLSWSSQETNPAATLISVMDPPDLGDNAFLWLKLPHLRYFAVAVLTN